VSLPVRQRTNAVDLLKLRRLASRKLPNDGVSDDRSGDRSNPTSATAASRNFGVFAKAWTPFLSLRMRVARSISMEEPSKLQLVGNLRQRSLEAPWRLHASALGWKTCVAAGGVSIPEIISSSANRQPQELTTRRPSRCRTGPGKGKEAAAHRSMASDQKHISCLAISHHDRRSAPCD
jgi:hypothetical protein